MCASVCVCAVWPRFVEHLKNSNSIESYKSRCFRSIAQIKCVYSFVCLYCFFCCFFFCFYPFYKIQQLVVVLFGAVTTAQYYSNSEPYPTISTNDQYYYQDAPPYQPIVHVQPPVHYQPFTNYREPVSSDGQWKTLRDNRHQSPSGEYVYEYETENGIVAGEQSYIASPNQPERKTVGFYQYPSPEDGHIIRVDWSADSNGFQVKYKLPRDVREGADLSCQLYRPEWNKYY